MRIYVCALALVCAVGCRAPARSAVASAAVSLNRHTALVGGPVEITYTFVVADQARFTEDYAVMLNVINADHELVWTDNHQPPTPTTSWTPGSRIQYTRTVFVPLRADPGDVTLQIGLYSPGSQTRLPLIGTDVGGRAYDAGRLRKHVQIFLNDLDAAKGVLELSRGRRVTGARVSTATQLSSSQ